MAQPLAGLRVSSPETIYAKLEEPTNPDAMIALRGLGELFGLQLPRYTGGIGGAWEVVSDAMIEDESAIEIPEIRPWSDNAKQVFSLMQNYPWIRNVYSPLNQRPLRTIISDIEFLGIFQDHTVDDNPGLFGVTVREAKQLRAMAHDSDDFHRMIREAGIDAQYDRL